MTKIYKWTLFSNKCCLVGIKYKKTDTQLLKTCLDYFDQNFTCIDVLIDIKIPLIEKALINIEVSNNSRTTWKNSRMKRIPDVEGAFLTGAEGAGARTHAAVHHLLPQVVDLGLKTTVFWKEKRHTIRQQHLYLQWYSGLCSRFYEWRCL